MKLCEFISTIGFRVWQEEVSVEVILCFGCNELHIGDEAGGDFDPVAKELTELMAIAFPSWQPRP